MSIHACVFYSRLIWYPHAPIHFQYQLPRLLCRSSQRGTTSMQTELSHLSGGPFRDRFAFCRGSSQPWQGNHLEMVISSWFPPIISSFPAVQHLFVGVLFFSYGRNYCMDNDQCLDDSPIFIMVFHSHVRWPEVMSVGIISKEQSRQTG